MVLFGYKRCSTCRNAQSTLVENGANVKFHDIVDSPPSTDTIRSWMTATGRPALDFVNTRGTVYRERGLKSAKLTEDEWIMELSKDGKLIKRPIVVTEEGDVYVGYDEATYRRLALAKA